MALQSDATEVRDVENKLVYISTPSNNARLHRTNLLERITSGTPPFHEALAR
jgi:hypothetical protein